MKTLSVSNLEKALKKEKKTFFELLKAIKKDISSDTLVETGDGYTKGIEVTIGVTYNQDGLSWGYQTGDNSYSGAAYFHPHWGLITVFPRSNCKELVNDIVDQVTDIYAQSI